VAASLAAVVAARWRLSSLEASYPSPAHLALAGSVISSPAAVQKLLRVSVVNCHQCSFFWSIPAKFPYSTPKSATNILICKLYWVYN
jgi:hypothetical protein